MTTGPTWTRGRLAALLGEFYGRTPAGAVDVAAAARELKVHPRTVRRWLGGPDDAAAAIPAERLEALTTAGLGRQAVTDRANLERMMLPGGRGMLPVWRESRWDEPHFVLLIQPHGHPWRQLILTRNGQTSTTAANVLDQAVYAAQLARKRGTLLDEVIVSNRFAGKVLIHNVMQRQKPWAIRPPKSALADARGRGQVWSDDAPEISLSALADEAGLR
ncbi:hypothetical protein [Nocardia tengchongensis]|uniref:hypothetical protein n=1 Tax=Nocardia tengchongensis TaxID=2055889 RepID=UPI003668ED4B